MRSYLGGETVLKGKFITGVAMLFLVAYNTAESRPNAYTLDIDRTVIINAVKIAKKQVGIIEIANNDSPRIREYLRSVGINRPASYCAAGIYWSIEKSIMSLRGKGNLSSTSSVDASNPLPRSGVANQFYNHAKLVGKKYRGGINPGDLLVWRKPRGWQGHIEMVVKSIGKSIITVGFNTSRIAESKRVQGVWYKKRRPNHPLGRLKYRGFVHFNRTTPKQ